MSMVLPPKRVAHLHIDLVTTQNNGNVLANPLQITVPVGNVLVCDSRCNVKHDDTTLTLDVVSITQSTKLLLSSSVPDVEADGTEVGVESQRVDLDTESSCVLVTVQIVNRELTVGEFDLRRRKGREGRCRSC